VTGGIDILDEIKRLAGLGRILLRFHARQRMADRGATFGDVQRALATADRALWQPDRQNWRVEGGVDLDGDELTVIVDVEADVIVVTLF
jgi:hypothetical protein